MTFYICLYIISFFSYIFLDFLIKRGLLGNNLRNKLIWSQNNQIEFSIYLFIIVIVILFVFMPDTITYFSSEETDKVAANIQGNSVNIHNPNVNIPNSFTKAVASLGIGGTIAAGMTTAGTLAKTSGPVGVRLGTMAAGGAVGGALFVTANYFNTVLQKEAKPVSNKTDIIFSTKSALDGNENDSLNAVLGLFNINLMLNICILYLLIVLAILFISSIIIENKLSLAFLKNIFGTHFHSFIMKMLEYSAKTNKVWMLIAWIILIIATLGSICISYFLLTHLDTIVEIYQNSKK